MDIEVLQLTEGGTLSVDDLLTKLESITNQMDRRNQPFDIDAVNLALRLNRVWSYGGLPIENWVQVARYNSAGLRIDYNGHQVGHIQADNVIRLNPALADTVVEYYEIYGQMQEAWREEVKTNFENGIRKKVGTKRIRS